MKLIVGLGNPGKEYEHARHNFGWQVLDALPLEWREKAKFHGLIAEKVIKDEKILFLKPTTFYNDSGKSVRAVMDFYSIPLENMMVIHDELSLPFGTIRTRVGGSDAGNNGIKSISSHIGHNYARIRLGIANNSRPVNHNDADFVLSRFNEIEQTAIPDILSQTIMFMNDFIDQVAIKTTTKRL